MSSRKIRLTTYSDDEEGKITTDEEDGEIEDSSNRRHKSKDISSDFTTLHKSKKSKKHKKDKKHKSKKHRRSRRSESPEDDQPATDKEGGSTPEMEAGEVVDISEEDLDDPKERSRSTSLVRSGQRRDDDRSRSPTSLARSSKRRDDRSRSPTTLARSSQRSDDKSRSQGISRGKMVDISDEDLDSRKERSRSTSLARGGQRRDDDRSRSPTSFASRSKRRDDRSRSPTTLARSSQRSDDRSRSQGISRGNSRSRTASGESKERSMSPPLEGDVKMPMPLPVKLKRSPSPEPLKKGSSESLSVDETNKLRASLGLAPLKINQSKVEPKTEEEMEYEKSLPGTAIPGSNVRHKPAENLKNKSATEKMRERLQQRKMKRMQESKLLSVATLGGADDVDDTAKWLQRQKKKTKEKKEADKRAKMLAEMDDEFGVGNLVKEDVRKEKDSAYNSRNLAGLTVQHDSSRFQDGQSVILTLKDSDVLGEDGDTLVNVNMMDDEKVDFNKEEIKKAKSGYNPYDQEEIDQVTGELRQKGMLDKYDDGIDGEAATKKSFVISSQGTFSEEEQRERARAKIREKLASHTVESLETAQMKVASDYYTEEEVVKFKKPKKKKKVKRKMLKADDLLGLDEDNSAISADVKRESLDRGTRGALPMDMDEEDVKPIIAMTDMELSRIKVDDDDRDLQLALKKARKIKQKKFISDDHAATLLEQSGFTMKQETEDDDLEASTGAEFINTFEDDKNLNSEFITINETSEFCRNLGAWQAHGASGLMNQVPKEIREFEDEMTDYSRKTRENALRPDSDVADSDEDMDDDVMIVQGNRHDQYDEDSDDKKNMILGEEPDLKTGMAAAILLATNKGYLETESRANMGTKLKHLENKNYTIDDKSNEDRNSRRGDRYGGGGGSSFQEKSDYKPNVRLDYMDDDGRILNRKEAFRHLSHKFHGKGSGKLKTEKRQKKVMEDNLMINMSSTDTPLNTLAKLRQKQMDSASPYVILTGNKVQPANLKK